ncbi:hypothetical protein ACG83_28855 [Frankia sp. R43]|uniref:GAP family protein n=1 Tax=Frankia sp. R43 TaxID=269536 RepID=UPI0006C9FBDB|nr:GAP family protein [Frankia sp. R43]KPM52393.1 hypothetical protein ACG83_28855 [Frankia sp. R43]
MGEAAEALLPLAVGAAISPLPIVAMILLLGAPRARASGPAFAVGWLVGLCAVAAIALAVADGRDYSAHSGPTAAVRVIKGCLGVLFLWRAAQLWRHRPDGRHPAPQPTWMATIQSFGPRRSARLGALVAAANPKNLSLTVTAAAVVAQSGVSGLTQAGALAVYALLGTVGILTPLVAYLALGERARVPLDEWRRWMVAHNGPVMMVLFLLLGALLLGKAIGGGR